MDEVLEMHDHLTVTVHRDFSVDFVVDVDVDGLSYICKLFI